MGCEGLIDDNRVLISLITCSMNPETEVTFTRGRFNKVVLAVIYLVRKNGRGYSRSGQLPITVFGAKHELTP